MSKPWQSYEEYQTDMALQNAISDPETIRNIRPTHPMVLFPERYGVSKTEPSIYDILDVNRYAANNRKFLSGFPVRQTMVDDTWSGAGRYTMDALG